MESIRKATLEEEKLIEFLLKKSGFHLPKDWKNDLLVKNMNDDGMGSLYLFNKNNIEEQRVFGKKISEYEFEDDDGILVIATLNIDKDNKLMELDIWKTDFSKLLKFPQIK